MRIGVLADDLTGAGDVALAFTAAGLKTEIWTPAGEKPRPPRSDVRVWVLDTESRSLSPRAAARRVRASLAALKGWKPDFYFKKIDSTLRGPVGAEIAAFLRGAPARAPVLVVPAFPALGRTTIQGRHFVFGVPLHRTAFGRDPRHPLGTNRLEDLVGIPPALRGRVILPDVTTSRDLARLAPLALGAGAAIGSAGLAAALARELSSFGGKPKRGLIPKPARPHGRVAVVIGSAHPQSARQGDRLEKGLGNFPRRSDVCIINAPTLRGSPQRVLNDLVGQARALEKTGRIRHWVATGGETAFRLAQAWRASRWRVAGAIETGMPLCFSQGRRRRWLVLKPGGFGSNRALERAVRILMGKEEPS